MVFTLRWLDHECFVYVFDGCLRRVSECLGLSQGGTATKTNRRDIEPDYELMPGPKIRAASGDGEPKQRIADRAMQSCCCTTSNVLKTARQLHLQGPGWLAIASLVEALLHFDTCGR